MQALDDNDDEWRANERRLRGEIEKLRAELARVTKERDRARAYVRADRCEEEWCVTCPARNATEQPPFCKIVRALADEPREEKS